MFSICLKAMLEELIPDTLPGRSLLARPHRILPSLSPPGRVQRIRVRRQEQGGHIGAGGRHARWQAAADGGRMDGRQESRWAHCVCVCV